MSFHHEHNHFEINKMLHSPMTKIYIFQAIMTFIKSLIGIFVPVYLYKVGFSIAEILLYSMAIGLTYLILIPTSIKIIKKLGFKYTLLITIPIYFTHILVLNFLETSIIFYHLAWLSFGTYMAFFWPAMHSEIAMNGSSKHRASQMGTLQILTTLFATLAPLVGGLVLEVSSYYVLLVISSIILFIGIIPLIVSKDIKLASTFGIVASRISLSLLVSQSTSTSVLVLIPSVWQ